MKSAKEQFVELGYEVRDHNFLEQPKEPFGWTTQDEPTLTYFQSDEEIGREVIVFHTYYHGVTVEAVKKRIGRVPAPLRPEEVEAIHRQMVELGWLKDADPVVHAHWNEFSDYTGTCYAECSRCGLLWWIEEGTAEENEMFYCPKCGAKMDGGENDGTIR